MTSATRFGGNSEFLEKTRQQVELQAKRAWYHSIQLPDGTLLPGLISVENLHARVRAFPIPEDLAGKRVLDVGAATGWCTFEMERRGASVVAVDCVEYEEFHIARKLLGSHAEYLILDVDELSPERLGVFDYVLFFGVLYHLRHPLLGLEKVCALTREAAFIESYVTDSLAGQEQIVAAPRTLEFYETDELGGQIDNWFGPSASAMLAMCRAAGFARVNLEFVHPPRAGATCLRHWEPVAADPAAPAPRISAAVNNRTNDVFFVPGKDEYICLYFKSQDAGLTRDALRPEVDGYGIPVITLAHLYGDGWQANMKLPPGLACGTHHVRLRTAHSAFSNAVDVVVTGDPSQFHAVAVAFPPLAEASAAAPAMFALENNRDGSAVFHGYVHEHLCGYFRSGEEALDRRDVLAEVDGCEQRILFLINHGNGEWQANAGLPRDLQPGTHQLRLRTRSSGFSNAMAFEFAP